jgi:transposase
LDLSDRYSYLCVLDGKGSVVEEGRIATTEAALRKRFGRVQSCLIAMEVGTHSPWVSRLLAELGHEVIVANARKLRLIYENRKKQDRVDARYLARVARLEPELLGGIVHRSEEAHADLSVMRSRDLLVRMRTHLILHVRGVVHSLGGRLKRCHAEAFAVRAIAGVPDVLRAALEPVLQVIATLSEKIAELDQKAESLAEERYPETWLMRQVGGVGLVTALTYVLTIEDPDRFAKSRLVGSYLGLAPGKSQSGDSDPQRRITKEGDRMLRRLLVQCAQHIVGPFGQDSDLRRYGLRIAERGGANAKKRAVIAVARKLAVLLHRLWKTGEEYEALYASRLQAA